MQTPTTLVTLWTMLKVCVASNKNLQRWQTLCFFIHSVWIEILHIHNYMFSGFHNFHWFLNDLLIIVELRYYLSVLHTSEGFSVLCPAQFFWCVNTQQNKNSDVVVNNSSAFEYFPIILGNIYRYLINTDARTEKRWICHQMTVINDIFIICLQSRAKYM